MFKKALFQKREVRKMDKQRFSVVYEKFTSKDIIQKGIMDNKENKHMCKIEEVCEKLNEQQATISKLTFEKGHLEAKNKRLEKQLQNLKDKIGFDEND